MPCLTCDQLRRAFTLADSAAEGKPFGAPEYREARRILWQFNRHFDACHQRTYGSRLYLPVPAGRPRAGTNRCLVCGALVFGKAKYCHAEDCRREQKRIYKRHAREREIARRRAAYAESNHAEG